MSAGLYTSVGSANPQSAHMNGMPKNATFRATSFTITFLLSRLTQARSSRPKPGVRPMVCLSGWRWAATSHRTNKPSSSVCSTQPSAPCTRQEHLLPPTETSKHLNEQRPDAPLWRAPASSMRTRWITFDCFGTLVDWHTGFSTLLRPIAGDQTEALVRAYHRFEPRVQAQRPFRPYRQVLTTSLSRAAEEAGFALKESQAARLPEQWGSLPIFADGEAVSPHY